MNTGLEYVYYIHRWGIAETLSYPLLLSSLCVDDSSELATRKINLVAQYIESFVVRRSTNFKKFASSSIRYTMYSLVKELRGKSLEELGAILSQRLSDMNSTWEGMIDVRLHGQNKKFVTFLLSRMTAFVEEESGMTSSFDTYYKKKKGKPFEIEHIWANKFREHREDFDQESEFEEYRNKIGGLVLIPRGTNQSYGSKPYAEKLPHYVKENLLAQSLCEITYQNNPNFRNMIERLNLKFEPHLVFGKSDLLERQKLYIEICKAIWPNLIGSQISEVASHASNA